MGWTVASSPPRVRVRFNGELEPAFSTIAVYNSTNHRVDKGNGRVDPSAATILEVDLPTLSPGTYRVSWSVVSKDTHRTEGGFSFIIVGPFLGVSEGTMMLSHIFLASLVRWIDLAGMVLLVGGLAIGTSMQNYTPGSFMPFFLLLTGFGDLVLRSQMMTGQPLAEIWGVLPSIMLKSHFGRIWILRTLLLCLLAVPNKKVPARVSREYIRVVVGALLLLTASLSGHAADAGNLSLLVLADWLHMAAGSIWVGGLFYLALMLGHRDQLSGSLLTSIKRYSVIAGVCVLLTLATGGYLVWRQAGSFGAVFQPPYGQMLKLLLVCLLLGTGAFKRYQILPKLSHQALTQSAALVGGLLKRLFNIVSLEVGLGLGILACVALPTQLTPARSQLLPAEGATVKIISPNEGQVIRGDEIPVRLIESKKGQHVHVLVDGELVGMFDGEKGRGMLVGVQPGRHILEVRLVAKDHITELDAADEVHFVLR